MLRPAELLSLRPGGIEASPGPAADALALLAGHVGRHAGQDAAHEGIRGVQVGVQEPGPLAVVAG